jgi:hypothetical protein
MSSTRVRNVAAALAAATALMATWAAPAGAAQSHVRTTCVRQAKVFNTPGGIVVGFLAHGSPVLIQQRTRNHRWAEVRAFHSIIGWIHTSDLC